MRVAIFTDNDFQKINGVTTALRAVLEHASRGVQPRIYTCDDEGRDAPDYLALRSRGMGVPFYREMRIYWPPFRRFLRQVAADGAAVIHLTTPGPVGLAGMRIASRLGLPVIGSFHTHLTEYARVLSGSAWLGDLMREYLVWFYGKCERILVPSESTRRLLIELKVDPAKLEIWRRGVSTQRFTPEKRSPALRSRWGVSRSRPALLYAGRLSREKDLALLRPLRDLLRGTSRRFRFVFVGDGPMRAELERDFPEAVFCGSLCPDEVSEAMASADLLLFPSQTDTAGNVVLEAQASGLPVLVTHAGGPSENMVPGRTGVICRDLGDFARETAELLLDEAKRRRLSEAARGYALTRTWQSALEPLYRCYLDVARSRAWSPVSARTVMVR